MSNKSSSSSSSGGVGFFGLLTIVFIVLKLTHFIDWSWWWVLAPTWIPLAILLVIVAILGIIWVAITIHDWYQDHKRYNKIIRK